MRGFSLISIFLICFIVKISSRTFYDPFRRYGSVTYTIRNQLKAPKFDYTLNVPLYRREPFIRVMERAADKNSTFRFSADYFDKELGYLITTINQVRANYTEDKSFWAFLRAPNTFLDKGVSNYFPSVHEHLIFNLTVGGHS